VQLLDREIEKTVRATDALREQTRVLHAEWTLLNDPQRLQVLADQFLSLKTVTPGQFTSLAELDSRLPAVSVPEPVQPSPDVPVAEAPVPVQPEEPPRPPSVAVAQPPVVARTASASLAPSPPHVPEHKPLPPAPSHQVVAEAPAVRPQPPAVRPVAATVQARPAPPRVVAASLPVQSSAGPVVGSALGMARGTVPPPQPMPVSASQWVSNGGGG
jgi:hypothetical protein